jgi:inner membrane protein
MDTLTHALAGALAARASAPRVPSPDTLGLRGRLIAGAVAAAFPDSDFVLGYVSPVVYLETHRGVTHSLLLLPLWALLLAWACAKIARDPRGYGPWFGVCALALATHIVGDLITGFGTMILAPLSKARFALGTTFIIDLWFTGIIVAGLVASLAWRRSRAPAVAASLVLAGYVGLQALAKRDAEDFGAAYAHANRLEGAQVVAHPRPVSPFNWTVFVRHGESVDYAHVNLHRRHARPPPPADAGFIERLDAGYRPLAQAHWERRTRFGTTPAERAIARSAGKARDQGWFADIPVFDGVTGGSTCVWFRDLRFETPGRASVPFRYGVCRDGPDERWRLLERTQDGGSQRVAR